MAKAKINKALDLNKLFIEQSKGKLLKKNIGFPLFAPIKFDGNYVVIEVTDEGATFTTSGGLYYTHLDDWGEKFALLENGVYLAERIYGLGKLGDRNKCNLKGSKIAQTSIGHSYKVFDYLTHPEYAIGYSTRRYENRANKLSCILDTLDEDIYAGRGKLIVDQRELDDYIAEVVKDGYEGVMGINPNWLWKDTKSRGVDFFKYKKRPTVDLLCISYKDGTGKYEGMIGSLILRDSQGREVDVGSGMSDEDRYRDPNYFVGNVVEMFYEQIVNTYIQPTFGSEYEGVLVRYDKTEEDID